MTETIYIIIIRKNNTYNRLLSLIISKRKMPASGKMLKNMQYAKNRELGIGDESGR